jgi:hypothetical protein
MWKFVNQIAAIIKALDGNHPVGTCTPNINADTVANGFQAFVPELDFFGANVYGFAATGYVAKVAGIIGTTGWNKPYLASEYGMSNWFTSGFPTSPAAPNGWAAYAEDPSAVKAATYAAAWQSFSAGASTAVFPAVGGGSGGLMVGGWAFNYGWVWQATATWVNSLNYYPYTYTAAAGGYDGRNHTLPGAWAVGNETSEVVDTLITLYSGVAPAKPAPSIGAPGIAIFTTPGGSPQYGGQNILLTGGSFYTASVAVTSAFPASLHLQWMLLPIPAGGPTDHTTYDPVRNATGGTYVWSTTTSGTGGSCVFQAPVPSGTYALSVWAYDGHAKFATHNVAFNSTAAASPFVFPADGDTFVYDAALYASPGFNAGYSSATCSSGNLTCWHPANSYQLQAYQNYGESTTITAQAFRPPGNNRFPFLHFSFPPASAGVWRPSPVSLPGQAFLNVYLLGGDPTFNVTCYGVSASWTEDNVTYASLGYAAGVPPAVGRLLHTTTASGGLSSWVQFDVSDFLLSQASAGVQAVAFALAAGSATVANSPLMTSAIFASSECATAVTGACTSAATAGANGPFTPYLTVLPSTAGITLQMSNTVATSLATAAISSGRRRARALLQQAPASPVSPPAPPPSPLTAAALTELDAIRTQLAAVAGGNVSAADITVSVSSHSVSASILMYGARHLDSWDASVQLAFITGVAADVGVSPSRIALSQVHDTFDFSGLDVPFSVNGFTSDTDDGLAGAAACAAALKSSLTNTLAAVQAAVLAHRVTRVVVNSQPMVYAQIASTLAVNANEAALSQTLLNNAVGSGALENSLRDNGVNEHVAPAAQFASLERDLSTLGCAPPAALGAVSAIAIAFIVYSGFVTCCLLTWRRRAREATSELRAAEAMSDAHHAWADKHTGMAEYAKAAHPAHRLPPSSVVSPLVYTADTDGAVGVVALAEPRPAESRRQHRARAHTPRAGAGTALSHDSAHAGGFA